MSEKEKLELTLDILKEIEDCMQFNFEAMGEHLNKKLLEDKIEMYKNMLEEENEIKN